jgi:hypothetical protein
MNMKNQLLEAMDNGIIDSVSIVEMCMRYMSEDDVQDMLKMNEVDLDLLEEPYGDGFNDDMDGDHESALASIGWGTDESYGGFFDEP